MKPSLSSAVHHLAAIALAGMAFVVICPQLAKRGIFTPQVEAPASKLAWPLEGYVPTYADEPYLAALLHRSLADGTSIILFGSSELTTAEQPTKPTVFFREEVDAPLLAVGHAGNQSFSIHAQLIAADTPLDRARLVILVSPGWFSGNSAKDGTSLEAFLEYQPSPSFYRVEQRVQRGDTLAAPYLAFLLDHKAELGAAQPIVQSMLRDADPVEGLLYGFGWPWLRYQVDVTAPRMLAVPELQGEVQPWSMPTSTPQQWEERYRMAVAAHLAQCTNNRVYVNDEYYTQYVHGDHFTVTPVPLGDSREMRDMLSLLGFLKVSGAKPLFVIQPLNPYVYTNVQELTPTMVAVRRAIEGHGFTALDMWVDDTARFEPGTLTDVMHLGPLGWSRIDSAITAFFP